MSLSLGSLNGYQLQAAQLAVLTLGKESFDRCMAGTAFLVPVAPDPGLWAPFGYVHLIMEPRRALSCLFLPTKSNALCRALERSFSRMQAKSTRFVMANLTANFWIDFTKCKIQKTDIADKIVHFFEHEAKMHESGLRSSAACVNRLKNNLMKLGFLERDEA
jgi:hypothetical protein